MRHHVGRVQAALTALGAGVRAVRAWAGRLQLARRAHVLCVREDTTAAICPRHARDAMRESSAPLMRRRASRVLQASSVPQTLLCAVLAPMGLTVVLEVLSVFPVCPGRFPAAHRYHVQPAKLAPSVILPTPAPAWSVLLGRTAPKVLRPVRSVALGAFPPVLLLHALFACLAPSVVLARLPVLPVRREHLAMHSTPQFARPVTMALLALPTALPALSVPQALMPATSRRALPARAVLSVWMGRLCALAALLAPTRTRHV